MYYIAAIIHIELQARKFYIVLAIGTVPTDGDLENNYNVVIISISHRTRNVSFSRKCLTEDRIIISYLKHRFGQQKKLHDTENITYGNAE